jgi:putative SOS response-associated peptidase YedK
LAWSWRSNALGQPTHLSNKHCHPLESIPLFCFPGVWTRYKGPLKKNGEAVEQDVFAFMTTEPNELTASINHERMPVLLSNPADFETWLSASSEEALKLARSYATEQMRIVQSGSERKDLLAA